MCHNLVINGTTIKIVRDDIFPFIGGGSKARKAIQYERFLREHRYNAVVTTGGIQSNHNRAIALMAARNGWRCHLVYHGTHERFMAENGNALLVRNTDADLQFVEPSQISDAMDAAMQRYTAQGLRPYYITGGGHDLPGGIAYVNAVHELYQYGIANNWKPTHIFHASGTGSTQAGIMVGLDLVGWSDVKVIGISVARQKQRGEQVVTEFANRLARHYGLEGDYAGHVIFNTDYLYGGYENFTPQMKAFLDESMKQTGLIFDTTYSGKAFYAMCDILNKGGISDIHDKESVLFWHTGGLMNLMK